MSAKNRLVLHQNASKFGTFRDTEQALRKQFVRIEHLMPRLCKKPKISNYDFVCALLYIIENGCKWRALQSKYGNWHTIYISFNRR